MLGTLLLAALFATGPTTVRAGEPLAPVYVELLQELVRTRSVNGKHAEAGVVEVLAEFARAHGCEPELTVAEPERPILTVTAGPKDRPGLLIIGHTDTVSAEPVKAWTHPAYGAEIEDGRLYGRGAIDCKGGIVAGLAAVLSAYENKNLEIPISLVCVPDEESGATGELGIKELARQNKLSGLGAIYAYPNMDKIILGHRGVYRFTLEIATPGGHTGARKWQDSDRVSALTTATMLVTEFQSFAKDLGRLPGEGLFADYRNVVTPAVLGAGVSPGLVPSSASLTVDVRLLPGFDLERIKRLVENRIREVRSLVGEKVRVEITKESYIPATVISTGENIVSAVSEAALREIGVQPKLAVSGPANESYLLNAMGIPTLILGPTGENAHAADEYVELDSVATAARIYREAHRLLSKGK